MNYGHQFNDRDHFNQSTPPLIRNIQNDQHNLDNFLNPHNSSNQHNSHAFQYNRFQNPSIWEDGRLDGAESTRSNQFDRLSPENSFPNRSGSRMWSPDGRYPGDRDLRH